MMDKEEVIDKKIERLNDLIRNYELKIDKVEEDKERFNHKIFLVGNYNLEDDLFTGESLLGNRFKVNTVEVVVNDYNEFYFMVPSYKKEENIDAIMKNLKDEIVLSMINTRNRLFDYKKNKDEIDKYYESYVGKVF